MTVPVIAYSVICAPWEAGGEDDGRRPGELVRAQEPEQPGERLSVCDRRCVHATLNVVTDHERAGDALRP